MGEFSYYSDRVTVWTTLESDWISGRSRQFYLYHCTLTAFRENLVFIVLHNKCQKFFPKVKADRV
jgi:hypothetical protein